MFRFSLATFLLVVAVVSLVLAGLVFPNARWERIIATATLVMLLAASITVIAWQKSSRWFWIGFVVAGWSYLALVFYGGDPAREILLTHHALVQLDEMLETSNPTHTPAGELIYLRGDDLVQLTRPGHGQTMSLEEAEQLGYMKYMYTQVTLPSSRHFLDIGHYAWALLLGSIGGIFSLWLRRASGATAG